MRSGDFTHYLTSRGAETAGSYTYKQLNTSLSLTYVSYPSVVNTSPSNVATAVSVVPTLTVTGTDPTGHGLTYRYSISTTSNFSNMIWTSPAGEPSSLAVPKSAGLHASTTYYWRAQVSDEYQGVLGDASNIVSGTWSFTKAANSAPGQPLSLSVTPWAGAGGSGNVTDGTPSFSAVTTDIDVDDVTTTFEVHDSTTVSQSSLKLTCVAGTVTSGDTANCGIPQQLADGTYYVRAKSNDGVADSAWSAWFTMPVSAAAFSAQPSTAGLYHSEAGRLLDTRDGTGGYSVAPLAPGWHPISVAGIGGLPSSGIAAVAVNIMAVGPAAAGRVYADANGVTSPNTSMTYLDYTATAGATTFVNSAIVPVGSDGKIQVDPTTATDLVIDVQGYYTSGSAAGSGYVPIAVATTVDTSTGAGGVPQAQVATGNVLAVQIGGVGSVPSDATSVVLNVSEKTPASTQGALAVYPDGSSVPSGSLNWSQNTNNEWTTTVDLPSSGLVDVKVLSGGPVDIAIAVEGYFTASSTSMNGAFTPTAGRVFDSVAAASPLAAGETTTIQMSGEQGIPETGTGVTAVALNITVSPGGSNTGQMMVFSDDGTVGPSQVDYSNAGGAASGYLIVPLGIDGGINLQNSSTVPVNFVVDIEGWFQGPGIATVSCPNSVHDGGWDAVPPTSSFLCEVTAPAAPTGAGVLSLSVDQETLADVNLSPTAPTVTTVTIPAGAAAHSIGMSVYPDLTGPSDDSAFSFGSGDWSNGTLVPSVLDGASSNDINPTLWASTSGAPFSDGTTLKYTVSTNSDGSNPILAPGWSASPLEIPEGTLSIGTTYYWRVQASGPSNIDGSHGQLTSPWWSFVATTDPYLDPQTTPQKLSIAGVEALGAPPLPDPRCVTLDLLIVRGTGAPHSEMLSVSGYAYKGTFYNAASKPEVGKKVFGGGVETNMVQGLVDAGVSFYAQGIRYPAASVDVNKDNGTYGYSEAQGVKNLRNEINSISIACPNTKIWILGYSQGGQVTGDVLAASFGTKLTDNAKAKMRAAVLLGNPTYYAGELVDESASATTNGRFASFRTKYSDDNWLVTGTTTQRVRSYCFVNDQWCQTTVPAGLDGWNKAGVIHVSYKKAATVNKVVAFFKNFLTL